MHFIGIYPVKGSVDVFGARQASSVPTRTVRLLLWPGCWILKLFKYLEGSFKYDIWLQTYFLSAVCGVGTAFKGSNLIPLMIMFSCLIRGLSYLPNSVPLSASPGNQSSGFKWNLSEAKLGKRRNTTLVIRGQGKIMTESIHSQRANRYAVDMRSWIYWPQWKYQYPNLNFIQYPSTG